MRNISLLFGILLLVNGVSGAEENTVPVPLLVGDSVTLQSGVPGLPSSDTTRWLFKNARIAEISRGIERPIEGLEKFKKRLQLDVKTGSLNITNINTEYAGEYKLDIRSKTPIIRIFNVTVKDGVKSVSVMEGDSVTLHTDVTTIDGVKWTSEYENLKPTDDQTGDLTINITGRPIRQRGKYVLEINNSRMFLQRTYHVVLIEEKPSISVKEGEMVFLITGVKDTQTYDLILWNFKGRTIAKIDKRGNSVNDSRDGRMQMNDKSGSLQISNSATTDTGDYNLTMSSSTHSLQRTISVTVSSADSGVATGAEAGIIVGLLVFLWCLQL